MVLGSFRCGEGDVWWVMSIGGCIKGGIDIVEDFYRIVLVEYRIRDGVNKGKVSDNRSRRILFFILLINLMEEIELIYL